jgi:antitoxin HicB
MFAAITYPARVEEAGPGDFVVTFPDIPEAITGAGSYAEAVDTAADALAAAVEGYVLKARAAPARRDAGVGEVAVPLAPALAARVLLTERMAADKLTKSAVARLIGKDEKVVRRILEGSNVSLDQILDALAKLGVRPALAV